MSATISSGESDERAAFEAWAKAYGRIFLNRLASGLYAYAFTQEAWVGWKARAALATQPAPVEPAPCKRCGGTRVVDDGEIDCYPDGSPYLNGPVKCIKDCPVCTPNGRPVGAESKACASVGVEPDTINDVLSSDERTAMVNAATMYGHFQHHFRPKALPRTADERDSVEGSMQELHDWFQTLERIGQRILIGRPPAVTIAELAKHDAAIAAARGAEAPSLYEQRRAHGYAPGDYMGRCTVCKDLFRGDKRAWCCEACADKAIAALASPAPSVGEPVADPLQGAADWLKSGLVDVTVADIQSRLLIGYNRARRLFDAAPAAAVPESPGATDESAP